MEEDDVYTKDGTVDIHKRPANKKKTGKWKACRFILGLFSSLFLTFNFDLQGTDSLQGGHLRVSLVVKCSRVVCAR